MMRRRRYRKRSPFHIKLKRQTIHTVSAVWLWLISGLILLSFFSDGAVLNRLRDELTAQLGWAMYLLPPYLATMSLLFFKLKSELGKPNIPVGATLLYIAFIALTRAGIIGETLFDIASQAIAVEGAFLLFLGILVIGLIVILNTSFEILIDSVMQAVQKLVLWVADRLENFFSGEEAIKLNTKKIPLVIKGLDEDKTREKSSSQQGSAKTGQTQTHPAQSGLMINAHIATQPADVAVWEYPPQSLLSDGPGEKADRGDVKNNANIIEKTLDSFGITAKVVEVNTGPAVTQYALRLSLGTKVSKITSLSSDMALALAAPTGQVRIEAPIPGRDLVGIEIPNRGLEFVTLKRMLNNDIMRKSKSKLTVALGLDVSGNPIVADIGRMPHVLIAGTTGSGKSVLINAFISSLLFRTTSQEVRIIMVDPKRVELTGYNGIPHLLTPVIVEPDKILSALHWAIKEMEIRYKQFAEVGVRNIDGFNELSGFQAMPYIVIFIDELADLMAYAPVDVEDSICRLAQMARATGIHLVVSTQRPSVDVITGLIKANIPARIAFNVSSMVDSRVIIDMPGAEKLLGRGDMLYIPPDQSKPSRIQGTFVSEKEVTKIVEFLRTKNVQVHYTEEVTTTSASSLRRGGSFITDDGKDPLFEDALRLICQHDRASASLLQRRLSIGYARAARILDQLEAEGIIGPGEGAKPRDVLMKNADEYLAKQSDTTE